VTDLPGAPASNEFWVRLQTYVDTSVVFSDPDGVPYPTSVRHIGEAKVASDGTFEFVRVPPGTYTAQVFPRGGPNIDSMTTRVVVRDVDVSGVQLKPFDRAWPEATRLPAPSVDPEVRPAALQARLQSLGGPTAKDCGHASLAQLRAGPGMQVIRCVEDAVERKTAFIASLQQQWFDTIVMVGIAAPQSGAVSVFDSYGDGMSAPRHCARPKFPTASGGLVGLLRCD
jgi:hypothetical protein